MKTRIFAIISFILVMAILCPVLFSCGSNNMKFSSEQEMIDYLNGTFENEERLYLIETGKITIIYKNDAFSVAEENLKKSTNSLPANTPVDKLKVDEYLSYCHNAIEYDISYNNKKGTVTYGSDVLSVDLNGNLCDENGNVYSWVSEEFNVMTDLTTKQFDEFKPVLVEYYTTNLGTSIVGTWKYKYTWDIDDKKEVEGYWLDHRKTMTFNENGTGKADGEYMIWTKVGMEGGLTKYTVYQGSASFTVFCFYEEGECYLTTKDSSEYNYGSSAFMSLADTYFYYERN